MEYWADASTVNCVWLYQTWMPGATSIGLKAAYLAGAAECKADVFAAIRKEEGEELCICQEVILGELNWLEDYEKEGK